MKRLGLVASALLLGASMSYASENGSGLKEIPFEVHFYQLSKYLDLDPLQIDEVANISDFFVEMQDESLHMKKDSQEKKMKEAVYGNLKLMKHTLTPEQYHKYLVLLNITNNNNRERGINTDYLVSQSK